MTEHHQEDRTVVRDLMPQSAKALEILRERAETLAAPQGELKSVVRTRSFFQVRWEALGQFGVKRSDAEEMLPAVGVTTVPGVPAHVFGVTSRRGQVIAVIDFPALVTGTRSALAARSRVITVRGAGMIVGLLVDEVVDERNFDEDDLIAGGIGGEDSIIAKYADGLHAGQVTILNMEKLLSDPSILVDDLNQV